MRNWEAVCRPILRKHRPMSLCGSKSKGSSSLEFPDPVLHTGIPSTWRALIRNQGFLSPTPWRTRHPIIDPVSTSLKTKIYPLLVQPLTPPQNTSLGVLPSDPQNNQESRLPDSILLQDSGIQVTGSHIPQPVVRASSHSNTQDVKWPDWCC